MVAASIRGIAALVLTVLVVEVLQLKRQMPTIPVELLGGLVGLELSLLLYPKPYWLYLLRTNY